MAFIKVPGTNLLWDQGSGYAFDQNGEDPISSMRQFTQADFDAANAQYQQPSLSPDGLPIYKGQITRGLRGDKGGENAQWGINPQTGQEEPVLEGVLLSDLLGKYGSIEGILQADMQDPGMAGEGESMARQSKGRYSDAINRFGARQSNDTFSGKDGLQDLITIAAMAAAAYGGGALAGGETVAGTGAAGTAGFEGGAALGAAESAPALGGGLTAGTTTGGVGGGALGTGVTASSTTGGVGGGALGTGVSGGTAGGGILGGTAGAGAASVGGLGSILSNSQAIGAGLGAASSLLGGGSKPAGTTTTVQDIPDWLKPYAAQGLGGLVDAYNSTPNGVAPVTAAGNQYMQDVIGGDYLNSNPYLDAMFNKASGQVGAKVNSQFSSAGRYGSGAHTGVLGESIGNLATDIYGGNYARERQNQQQAAASSAAFGNSIISQPFLKGQNLLQGVNSIKGGTTSTPYFQNQAGDILSGALGGMALGKLYGNAFA